MSWSASINVMLGLTLAYLVFSIAVSRINEFVASRLQWRAQGLERALYTLLDGTAPAKESAAAQADGTPVPTTPRLQQLSAAAVKAHPIIAAFDSQVGKKRRSSYLPARAVSAAVLDILAPPAVMVLDSLTLPDATKQSAGFTTLRRHPDAAHLQAFLADLPPATRDANADKLVALTHAVNGDVLAQAHGAVVDLSPENPARPPLLRMLADAQDDRDAFRHKLEHWYDDSMDRVSGWYKRRVQRWIAAYGLALAVLFNVDTINIAQTLWRSPTQQAAVARAAATAAGTDMKAIDTGVSSLKSLSLPVGWTPAHSAAVRGHSVVSTDPRRLPHTAGQWVIKVLGLALTGFALSFGAPFWFDVLGNIARLRNTGNVPAKQPA